MTLEVQNAEENRNIRNLLGIPNECYDLELIFPVIHDHTTSGDRRLRPKYFIASNVATIDGCPSLSSDHGSDVTSHNSECIGTVNSRPQSGQQTQLSQIRHENISGLSIRLGLATSSEEVEEAEEADSTYSATSLDSFDSDGVISEDETDDESEQSNSICELILADFRGELDLLPDVYARLFRESEAYRQTAPDINGTPASKPSKVTIKKRGSSSKRGRAADDGDRSLNNEGPPKTRPRIARNNTKILDQLKFGCAFNKLFPSKYCIHTSIGGPDNFYQPCSGTGWTKIRHLVDHYAEKHGRPQCLSCLDIFVNTHALVGHMREGHCTRSSDRSGEEPIDPAVMERIKHACSNASAEHPWSKEEIKWYKICFILFPLSLPPKSPYTGQEAEIFLLRLVVDSLNNRIQAEPNSISSRVAINVINNIQDLIQELNQSLGPTIEESRISSAMAAAREALEGQSVPLPVVNEHTNSARPESSQSSGERETVSSSEQSNIDPRILFLNRTEQTHLMPSIEMNQHPNDQPASEARMYAGQSEGNLPATFRGSHELFDDSVAE